MRSAQGSRPLNLVALCCFCFCALGAAARAMETDSLPPSVVVMPVFVVPSGSQIPDPESYDQEKLLIHLELAQSRYSQMLGNCPQLGYCLNGRTTFSLVSYNLPTVIHDPDPSHTAAFYAKDGGGSYALLALSYFGMQDKGSAYDRYNNPYIFVIVAWGVTGGSYGISLNGGLNTGGGIVVIMNTSWQRKDVQSTIQHELGHSFGLPHSYESGYGADPRYASSTGLSIMSQNPSHWTNGYDSASQSGGVDGILLPEDIVNLSLNQRVFPGLYFDPETDMTQDYGLAQPTAFLGTLALDPSSSLFQSNADVAPDSAVQVTTASGTSGGAVSNVLGQNIKGPLISRSQSYIDEASMWRSDVTTTGWVSLQLQFVNGVSLNGLGVHTGYLGGDVDAADQVCVQIPSASGYGFVSCQEIGADDQIAFSATTSSLFTIWLHTADHPQILVRGLQLLTPEGEIFPHKRPQERINHPQVTTFPNNETYSSKVGHVLGLAITPDNAQAGYVPQTMWHSAPVNSLGWTSLQVTFPYPVTLKQIDVYSEHSGKYHAAKKVQLEYLNGQGQFTAFLNAWTSPNAGLPFSPIKARTWKVDFYSTDGYITIRGLRFHSTYPAGYLYPDAPYSLVYP